MVPARHYRLYLADTMILCYITNVLPPAVAGWLDGFNPLPPAALTPKWPFPLAVKCKPPVQPHSVPRATHVDVFLSGNPMSGRACIYSFFECQSLSLSISPGRRLVLVSCSPSSLFVNGKSPDLVPLFVLVRAAFVTPACVRCPLSNPSLSFSSVRLVGPGYCLPLPFSPPSFQATTRPRQLPPRPRPRPRPKTHFLGIPPAYQLESTSTSTWSSRIHFARSLDKSHTLVSHSLLCAPPTPDEFRLPNQSIGSDLVTARQPRQSFSCPTPDRPTIARPDVCLACERSSL